jgi:hypothetical protein
MTVTADMRRPGSTIGVNALDCDAFSAVTRNGSVTLGVTAWAAGTVTEAATGALRVRVTVLLRFRRRKRLARWQSPTPPAVSFPPRRSPQRLPEWHGGSPTHRGTAMVDTDNITPLRPAGSPKDRTAAEDGPGRCEMEASHGRGFDSL